MIFPTQNNLKEFIALVISYEGFLAPLLPSTSDFWLESMIDMVEVCRIRVKFKEIDEVDIYKFAACLFLKIATKHEMSDGNKRSAVIMLYFFLIINDKYEVLSDIDPWKFREIAKIAVRYIDEGNLPYNKIEEDIIRLFYDVFEQDENNE